MISVLLISIEKNRKKEGSIHRTMVSKNYSLLKRASIEMIDNVMER